MELFGKIKLRLSSKLTFKEVTRLLVQQKGYRILSGPFEGMNYLDESNGSVLWAKLVGTYECELIPVIEGIITRKYAVIIDIGCAEGYYAVGLALKTNALVKAFDIDQEATKNLKRLAELNQVSERISVDREFSPVMLSQHKNDNVLLICDVEGAEKELLDPQKYPELCNTDILVEVHDGEMNGVIHNLLVDRFKDSHNIEVIAYNKSHPLRVNALPNVAARKAVAIITAEGRKYGISWMFLTKK
jgi:hypothetical protein